MRVSTILKIGGGFVAIAAILLGRSAYHISSERVVVGETHLNADRLTFVIGNPRGYRGDSVVWTTPQGKMKILTQHASEYSKLPET